MTPYDKDRFESTSWTVNGKLGALNAVYTGGYLVRKVEQLGDYTNYSRGVYSDYYQCYGPGSSGTNTLVSTCYSPSSYWRSIERNQHQQHELRFSTPDDWRTRGIVGAFWENNVLYDQTSWHYKSIPACTDTNNVGCLSTIGTVPGTTVQNPGVQPDDTSFNQDERRETKQLAFFASFDFDIIPKKLTLTVGTRHFRFTNKFVGSVGGSFGCFEQGAQPGGCPNYPAFPTTSMRKTSSTRKKAGKAASISPGMSRRMRWSTRPTRRASVRVVSIRTACRRTRPDQMACRST